jgi:hypothetical protein
MRSILARYRWSSKGHRAVEIDFVGPVTIWPKYKE